MFKLKLKSKADDLVGVRFVNGPYSWVIDGYDKKTREFSRSKEVAIKDIETDPVEASEFRYPLESIMQSIKRNQWQIYEKSEYDK